MSNQSIPPQKTEEWPECSGDPACCPENSGYGCGKPNPPQLKTSDGTNYECASCGWSGPSLALWNWPTRPTIIFCGGCKVASITRHNAKRIRDDG